MAQRIEPIQILGLRARWGPLNETSVRLSPGINVLYGLNGAGKTRVLQALTCAVRGLAVPNPRPWSEPPYAQLIVSNYPYTEYGPVRGQAADTPPMYDGDIGTWEVFGDTEDALYSKLVECSGKLGWAEEAGLHEALMKELALGCAVLTPIGRGSSRWSAFSAVRQDAGPARPLVDAERAWLDACLESDDLGWIDPVRWSSLFSDPWRTAERFHGGLNERTAHPDDGLPLPVIGLGEVWSLDELLPALITEGTEPIDYDGLTRRAAFSMLSDLGLYDEDSEWVGPVVEWARRLQGSANGYYKQLLLDAPQLTLDVAAGAFLVLGKPLEWQHDGRGLDDLSRAERRWALIAIQLALLAQTSTAEAHGRLLVLDEPEAALHRTAEDHLATGLESLSDELGLQVVLATHSPALESIARAEVQLVHRSSHGASGTQVSPMPEVTRETLADLGMTPSDLLRRWKAFLLVEGHHDQLILERLVGTEFEKLRTKVIPLHGGKELPATFDSQFLFDFSPAIVVPVVDNVDPGRLTRVWDAAVSIAATSGVSAAGEHLRKELPPRASAENKFLGQFLSKAIATGTDSRVVPHAFQHGDIIEYLPSEFFAGNRSWEALRARHAEQGQGKDFKKWLTATFGAKFDDETLLTACDSLSSVPAEFNSLVNLIGAHSQTTLPGDANARLPNLSEG